MASSWSNRPPFYEFLDDEYLKASRSRIWLTEYLEGLSPHELYASDEGYFSSNVRGIGKKGEQNIRQIINEWKPYSKGQFCKCGEPLLDWYQFCPNCGQTYQEE